MGKQIWKPGNMLYPVPAVMVTAAGRDNTANIITVAWAGTICTNPPMLSISIRPERYSYGLIRETGEFVVNLTTEQLAEATDFCGVRSGRDLDKFAYTGLTKVPAQHLHVPMIAESPVNIECRVTSIQELGSHHMFLAEVLAVHADEQYMNENNKFELERAKPIVYSHGAYMGLGEILGTFGYSVKREKGKKKK